MQILGMPLEAEMAETEPEVRFFALDFLEKEKIIKDCLAREDLKNAPFRHLILSYQFVELAEAISHDPKVNPGAEPSSGQDLAVGQTLMQIGMAAESLGISLRPAHSLENLVMQLDGKFGRLASQLQVGKAITPQEKEGMFYEVLTTVYNLALFRNISPAAAWTAGIEDLETKAWQQRRGAKKPRSKPISESDAFRYAPIEKRIGAALKGESKDLGLRGVIAMQQVLALGRYVAHDPQVNKGARPHTVEMETKEYGQALVQLAILAKYWGVSLAGYHLPQNIALSLCAELGRFSAMLSQFQDSPQSHKAELGQQLEQLLARTYVYSLMRGIPPEQAWQRGIANQKDADWRKRQGKLIDGQLTGIYVGPELRLEGVAYVHNSKELPTNVPTNAILVTRHFTQDMTAILGKFCGVVTDEGGKTCHLANIIRYGKTVYLPCVIAVGEATKYIKHGDKLRLEHTGTPGSEQGKVTLLDYKPPAASA